THQVVNRRIDKTKHDASRDLAARCSRQKVGQDGTAIPEAMAVGPGLVLPRGAPERGTAYDGSRGVLERAICGRATEDGAIVARPQPAQGKIVRPKVVDARGQLVQCSTDQVQVNVIQCAGARGGAKKHLAAQELLSLRDASAEIEYFG